MTENSKIDNINNDSFYNWNKYFGVNFLDNGNLVFKLFTFPYVVNVTLQLKLKGQPIQEFSMNKISDCIWQFELSHSNIQQGDRYRFIIDYGSTKASVKDPCSMWQDVYFKWSRIYNHKLYEWTDYDWQNNLNTEKISRLSTDTSKLSPVASLRIYELHIGTFTDEGTFKSTIEALPRVKELGFNAIEIMPVENTYSFNWGYDGVDKYSPNHTYGTPDDLKDLINYAHNIGLNVIMDIVPNHLGPDIAQLQLTGPYLDGVNCFGYKFNFEKDEYRFYTRDYIVGTALNWILNYHCDGLRVDMTKFMCSDFTMKQMAAEVNYYAPKAFLIAEDGRDNDSRVTKRFSQNELEDNKNEHEVFLNKIKNNDVSLTSLGFDTEWDFPFHKQIAATVLGSWDCRIKNICNFDYSLSQAQSRVKYPMSHDEIGNIDGTRLVCKIVSKDLNISNKICDCTHDTRCKIAAHSTQNVLKELLSGKLENYTDYERKVFYLKNNINFDFTFQQVFSAYMKAISQHKLALAKIYSIPGPKMIFQGDENANLAYFKFFRKFSFASEPYLLEKGYLPGLPAFLDSKLNSIYVDKKYTYINKGVENLTKDLNNLNNKNDALSSGHIEKTIIHQNSDIHAIHTKKHKNEIFSISNFSDNSYAQNYGILFPKGKWREILNTDSVEYAGSDEFLNTDKIFEQYGYISIAKYGVIFFEKID